MVATNSHSAKDRCPICQKDPYLNPNLKFLVNDCYHKMCESCIDRIFSMGSAPCPICHRLLRKAKFRKQTFEDIAVEREVDVRRRVAEIMNMREEDFATLDEYNDYLEQVENITFNLVNGVDVPETEAQLKSFEVENKNVISMNVKKTRMEIEHAKKVDNVHKQLKGMAREEARVEDAAHQQEREQQRLDLIRELAASDANASQIVARNAQNARRRSEARRSKADIPLRQELLGKSDALMFQEMEIEDQGPFDPLKDQIDLEPLIDLHYNFVDPFLKNLSDNPAARAGGFAPADYYRRAIWEARGSLLDSVGDDSLTVA